MISESVSFFQDVSRIERRVSEGGKVYSPRDVMKMEMMGQKRYLTENVRVYHGRSRKETLGRRRKVIQISVEEDAKERLGNPGENRFLPEYVEC